MALETVPTDVVGDDLIRTYENAVRRLEALVTAGLRRGLDPARLGTPGQRPGDATAAYRARQLAAARAITAELERMAPRVAPIVVRRAYASTLYTVDRLALAQGAAALDTRFGGVHQRAVAELAANMSASLERAAARAGESVAAVFARADALEAGVPAQGFPFLGRRADDPWRRVGLDVIGEGLVNLETRKQISAELYARLIREGVTDAATGFIDRAGRRWSLDTYAAMVTRTTTREATSRATDSRMGEHGLDLVTISSHPHQADPCTPFDGKTFSRSGEDPRYPLLAYWPPFHPYCRHVGTPASFNLDDFERELATAAEQGVDVGDLERAAPAGARTPPLSSRARPSTQRATPGRKEAQDRLEAWETDPGIDAEDLAGRRAWQDATAAQDAAYARARARADEAALDEALGPDLSRILDDLARSGYRDARDVELKRALIAGEVEIEYVEALAEDYLKALTGRRADRARAEAERGLRRRQINCFVCGQLKRRPADVCTRCGDDPVSYGGDAHEFNRAHGYGD